LLRVALVRAEIADRRGADDEARSLRAEAAALTALSD